MIKLWRRWSQAWHVMCLCKKLGQVQLESPVKHFYSLTLYALYNTFEPPLQFKQIRPLYFSISKLHTSFHLVFPSSTFLFPKFIQSKMSDDRVLIFQKHGNKRKRIANVPRRQSLRCQALVSVVTARHFTCCHSEWNNFWYFLSISWYFCQFLFQNLVAVICQLAFVTGRRNMLFGHNALA